MGNQRNRWKKKTDFYSLFYVFSSHIDSLPLAKDKRIIANNNLMRFGEHINEIVRLKDEKDLSSFTEDELLYAKSARASTDYSSRKVRNDALENLLKDCWD